MADKKKEYLIGDVSRIVGLSRDALRFYEKKGVIRANKKENGYRYFSDEDIYRLMCIVYRRKMNDSLEEIREFVKDNRSVAGMRQHLKQRIKAEEEEILRHRQSIARLRLSLKDIDRIEAHMGKYSMRDFPQAYILNTCEDIYDGLRQWFSMSSEVSGLDMTYFYNMFCVENGSLENRGTQLLVYRGLEHYISDSFDLSGYPLTDTVPCIYTIVSSEELLPDHAAAEKMTDWAEKQGLMPSGMLYSNNMCSFLGEETDTYYLELYMPVIQSQETR